MATTANLYVDQGTSFSAIITLTNQDSTVINLTGYTVQAQFRKAYKSSTYVPFDITIINAAAGQVQLQLSPSVTTGVRAGRYLYDIEITSPTNERVRALEGIVMISPEITGATGSIGSTGTSIGSGSLSLGDWTWPLTNNHYTKALLGGTSGSYIDGQASTNGLVIHNNNSVTITVGTNTPTWVFDSSGNLVLPAGGSVVDTDGNSLTNVQLQPDWNQTDPTSFDYIKNKPTIPTTATQSDWNQTDNTSLDFIKNKPTLFSGSYTDLTNTPSYATVATSGSYSDLSNKPTIPSAQIIINSFAAVATSGSYNDLLNKPTLAVVATTGSYEDLINRPTLFSGSYADLTGKPTIPVAPIQPDWAQTITTALDYIKNKPMSTSAFINDSGYATQSYVQTQISNLVNSAPTALNTLNELATALGNDPNFATTISTALGNRLRVDVNNQALSTLQKSNAVTNLGLSAVATSGSYTDLTNKPTLFSGSYTDLTNKPTLFSGVYADLTGKPTLFSGSYTDLTNKPTLFSGSYTDLTNKPTLFSGSYTDLTNKPTITTTALQWTANHSQLPNGANTRYLAGDVVYNNGYIYVANFDNESMPTTNTTYWTNIGSGKRLNLDGRDIPNITYSQLSGLPTLFSGSYNDLTNKPTLGATNLDGLTDVDLTIPPTSGQVLKYDGSKWVAAADATTGGTGLNADTLDGFDSTYFLNYSNLTNKPTLFSGSYTDLTNKPTIPAAQVNSDWNATSGLAQILNKPTLFSGSYTDLTNKPTIPAAQVNSDWNATSGLAQILNKPTLFSGSYTDLTNKPTIPSAQIQSDWNQTNTSALDYIKNKPTVLGGVTQIVAGSNITISPTGGTGTVTINATGTLSATADFIDVSSYVTGDGVANDFAGLKTALTAAAAGPKRLFIKPSLTLYVWDGGNGAYANAIQIPDGVEVYGGGTLIAPYNHTIYLGDSCIVLGLTLKNIGLASHYNKNDWKVINNTFDEATNTSYTNNDPMACLDGLSFSHAITLYNSDSAGIKYTYGPQRVTIKGNKRGTSAWGRGLVQVMSTDDSEISENTWVNNKVISATITNTDGTITTGADVGPFAGLTVTTNELFRPYNTNLFTEKKEFIGTLFTKRWSSVQNTAVKYGDSIVSDVISGTRHYYRVTIAGTLSGTPPTHTSGSATNGTATLTYDGPCPTSPPYKYKLEYGGGDGGVYGAKQIPGSSTSWPKIYVGKKYRICQLPDVTDPAQASNYATAQSYWNTIANTTNVTYVVGNVITAQVAGPTLYPTTEFQYGWAAEVFTTTTPININTNNRTWMVAFHGGSRNNISGNTINGGHVNIIFMPHRGHTTYAMPMSDNNITENHCSGSSEEGISLDCLGNGNIGALYMTTTVTADVNPVLTNVVPLAHSIGADNVVVGRVLKFLSGVMNGQSFKITASTDTTVTLGDNFYGGVESWYNAYGHKVVSGDLVSIEADVRRNKITNNTIVDSLIDLYGIGDHTVVANNTCMMDGARNYNPAGISVVGLQNCIAARAGTYGSVGCSVPSNVTITGNTVAAHLGIFIWGYADYAYPQNIVITNNVGGICTIDKVENVVRKNNRFTFCNTWGGHVTFAKEQFDQVLFLSAYSSSTRIIGNANEGGMIVYTGPGTGTFTLPTLEANGGIQYKIHNPSSSNVTINSFASTQYFKEASSTTTGITGYIIPPNGYIDISAIRPVPVAVPPDEIYIPPAGYWLVKENNGATPVVAMGETAAARLLNQATFGATLADITTTATKSYDQWFNEQKAITRTKKFVDNTLIGNINDVTVNAYPWRGDWWTSVVQDSDQLRQRMALALSEILVVSSEASIITAAMANYLDILYTNALGNYETLLNQVNLSPAMGLYLNTLNNYNYNIIMTQTGTTTYGSTTLAMSSVSSYGPAYYASGTTLGPGKRVVGVNIAPNTYIVSIDGLNITLSNPAIGTGLARVYICDPSAKQRPDENYAREVMQLFSIGLWMLNDDGTYKLSNGEPIPTYDQNVVTETSKIFTGWTYNWLPYTQRTSLPAIVSSVSTSNSYSTFTTSAPHGLDINAPIVFDGTLPTQLRSTANPVINADLSYRAYPENCITIKDGGVISIPTGNVVPTVSLTSVSILDTSGQISYTSSIYLVVGDYVTIVGSCGSITGHTATTTYKVSSIIETTPTKKVRLVNLDGTSITTTAGTITNTITAIPTDVSEISLYGTFSNGSITGYSSPTSYKISSIVTSGSELLIKIRNLDGSTVSTTAGTTTANGLTAALTNVYYITDKNFTTTTFTISKFPNVNNDWTIPVNALIPMTVSNTSTSFNVRKYYSGQDSYLRGSLAVPMISPSSTEQYHDPREKNTIGYGGEGSTTYMPENGQVGMQTADIQKFTNILFKHPNVGPFVSKQLIQRLVTSNPTPEYVARVTAVFNNNGSGVRGDLFAVAKAILTDIEATSPPALNMDQIKSSYGKLREPMLRLSHMWRAFNASTFKGDLRDYRLARDGNSKMAQNILQAPSVFNFFTPDYTRAGTIIESGIVAPEFQITGENQQVTLENELMSALFRWKYTWNDNGTIKTTSDGNILPSLTTTVAGNINSIIYTNGAVAAYEDPIFNMYTAYNDITYWVDNYASNATTLIDKMNLVFMAGTMPTYMRTMLINHVNGITSTSWLTSSITNAQMIDKYNGMPNPYLIIRVLEAASAILFSPQYAVQR